VIVKPRYTILAGLLFAGVGVVYGLVSRDPGGTVMLLALGIAMAVLSYTLIAASPRGDEQ